MACGACMRSDDNAAPEAFKIAQKSTESQNFSPLYLPIYLSYDHGARGKVVDLCEVNNIDLRIKS